MIILLYLVPLLRGGTLTGRSASIIRTGPYSNLSKSVLSSPKVLYTK